MKNRTGNRPSRDLRYSPGELTVKKDSTAPVEVDEGVPRRRAAANLRRKRNSCVLGVPCDHNERTGSARMLRTHVLVVRCYAGLLVPVLNFVPAFCDCCGYRLSSPVSIGASGHSFCPCLSFE